MVFSNFGQSGPEVSWTCGIVLIPPTQPALNLVNASSEADDGNPPGAVFCSESANLLKVLR